MVASELAETEGGFARHKRGYTATELHCFSASQIVKTEHPPAGHRQQDGTQDKLCFQVPQGVSPFEAAASRIRPLDDCPSQFGPPVQARFGLGDEAGSDASLQQFYDAQVPDIAVDSRRGSPCQQAAHELFDRPSPAFEARRLPSGGSMGLQSSISQTLAEQLIPHAPLPVPQARGGSSYSAQDDFGASSDGLSATLPNQAGGEVDFITLMMEQAQSVGLWREPRNEGRAPWPPSGQPILPDTLLSQAAAGVDEKHFANANPLAVYESGMASLLPDKCGPRKAWGPQPAFEGVGIIDRDILNNEARTSSLPRLQPVSLDIPQTSIQAAFSGSRAQNVAGSCQWLPNGPYRPATLPRSAASGKGREGEMMHPMLQQSKLQLSLGLAADKPLDLKSWGYGSHSAATQGCSATSERIHAPCGDSGQRPMGRMPAMPSKMPALLSLTPAMSDSTTHQSICTSPSAGQNNSSAATFQMPAISAGLTKDGQIERKAAPTSMSHEDGSSRLESLERYREKKRRRLFSKTIRYHKRKVNADKRPRIKGRFVKASESSAQGDDDLSMSEGHDDL